MRDKSDNIKVLKTWEKQCDDKQKKIRVTTRKQMRDQQCDNKREEISV